jgi:mono/diheme cytochrome c family protein
MQVKIVIALVCMLAFISCHENSKSSNQNNIIDNTASIKKDKYSEGKDLFIVNCASCHMVQKRLTGPALAGVTKRWEDKDKLYAFIKNTQDVIKTDKYAKDLYERYNKTAMNVFSFLTDEQIECILVYVETEARKKMQ